MPNEPNSLRERLLALGEPSHENLTRYQQETQKMLNRLETGLRREKWGVVVLWLFAVAFVTATLLIVGFRGQIPPDMTMLAMAFVLLVCGGIEIVKHFVNRSRIEVLKEIKSLELQVRTLKESND